jgi:hypothetical protein
MNNQDTIARLRLELASEQVVLDAQSKKVDNLFRKIRHLESIEFVSVNRIKISDVEMSDGDGKPFFGEISHFVKWLNIHSKKNWAEWNTVIYRQSDLKAGRMPPDMPAIVRDLLPD